MEKNQIARVTAAFPCFASVPQEEWRRGDILLERIAPRLAMEEGHLFAHAAFVVEGRVRIHKISENGREVTLYRVQNGGVCVLMMASILGETGYAASAEVEVDSDILLLPVEVFKQWMDTYKELRQFIYQTMIARMVTVTSLVENIAFKPINARIAEMLVRRTDDTCAVLHMTHDALAIELGTAREVISRALKSFEHEGWLRLGRGRISHIQRDVLTKQFLL